MVKVCGGCAYYNDAGTNYHLRGTCHGLPPMGFDPGHLSELTKWPIVGKDAFACSLHEPRKAKKVGEPR